jgi:hypothetical protein
MMRIKKQLAVIIMAMITLVVLSFFIAFLLNRNNNETINGKEETTTQGSMKNQLSLSETLKSSLELTNFNKNLSEDNEAFMNVGDIDSDNIDWESEEVMVVEFYIPAGQSVKDITLVDDRIIVSVYRQAQNCIFSAVQVKQVQFIVVPRGQSVQENEILMKYFDNPASCDDF